KEEEEIPPFLPFEDQPQPIGGMDAIRNLVKYPELAQKAGIEGLVIIQVLVDKEGVPREFNVVQSLGNNGCDEAAIDAIRQVRFIPAKQNGSPVPFRMNIPVRFQIR
ncbi:energy transducer TonB, partial [candidate division KSB1 bacterium]